MKKMLRGSFILVALAFAFALPSCGAKKELLMENQNLASSLAAARARGTELEEKLGETEAKLDAASSEIEELKTRMSEMEGTIASLENRLALGDDQIEDLSSRLGAVRNELIGSFEEIDSLEATVHDLSDSMKASGNAMQRQIADLTEKKRDLERQVSELGSDLDEASDRNEALSVQADALKESLEAAERRYEGQSRTVEEYRSTIDAQGRELEALRAENERFNAEVAAIQRYKEALLEEEEREKERMKNAYESLLASLKGEIDQKTIQIESFQNALTINIMDQIFFDSGKADLKKEGLNVLDRIAPFLANLEDKIIRIEGHTDDVPIGPKIKSVYPSNWELAAARSSSVARYFIEKRGIDPTRIVAVSYSMYRPLAPNISEENRAKNRRIEIVLTDRSLYEMIQREDGRGEE